MRRWRRCCLLLVALDVLLLLSLDPGSPHIPLLYLVRSLGIAVLLRAYRIDRVYPRLAKSAFLSSSSMNASIVQTFFSRTILMVLPVALFRMWDVSMPVASSRSKMTLYP